MTTFDVSNLAGGSTADATPVSWDTPGMIIAGEVLDFAPRPDKFNEGEAVFVLTLSTNDGPKDIYVRQWRLKTALAELGEITTGETIKIKYVGEDRMPNGHSPKNFAVKRGGSAAAKAPAKPAPAPAVEDDDDIF